jgi:heparan-alpha-glucosaminide N-acetyltransferase
MENRTMAADIAVSEKNVATPVIRGITDNNTGGRLISLDAYRGLIMLLLVSHALGIIEARTAILQSYPQLGWLTKQVDHSEWTGVTLWDLIQPAFTFMVGVAMPFAFARRISKGATFPQLFRHVAWRSFMLLVLSNVLSNFDSGRTHPQLQFINVLCQIAFGYMICFLITRLRFSYQVICAIAMLAGYWALFVLFPGPQGAFSRVGNIGQVIDLRVLGYNYPEYYTTINFIGNAATILFGYWAGMLLQSHRSQSSKLKILTIAAVTGFVLGLALEPFNPMVKRLWTVSFTFFSAGWVILMLMAFYWVIEMKQIKRWAFPMIVVGMNSIFIYSFSQVLRGWLNQGLKVFTGNFSFMGGFGAIPQNILVLLVIWYLCLWLYKRKIFIKI